MYMRLSADLHRVADAYSHGTNDCVCKSFSDDIVSWLSSELSAQIFTLSGIPRLDCNTVHEFIAHMTLCTLS